MVRLPSSKGKMQNALSANLTYHMPGHRRCLATIPYWDAASRTDTASVWLKVAIK